MSHCNATDLRPKPYQMSEHVKIVYECLFYHNMKWPKPDGPVILFMGEKIHYSEFMQAKKGLLK